MYNLSTIYVVWGGFFPNSEKNGSEKMQLGIKKIS